MTIFKDAQLTVSHGGVVEMERTAPRGSDDSPLEAVTCDAWDAAISPRCYGQADGVLRDLLQDLNPKALNQHRGPNLDVAAGIQEKLDLAVADALAAPQVPKITGKKRKVARLGMLLPQSSSSVQN